jgi:hypothetical protein
MLSHTSAGQGRVTERPDRDNTINTLRKQSMNKRLLVLAAIAALALAPAIAGAVPIAIGGTGTEINMLIANPFGKSFEGFLMQPGVDFLRSENHRRAAFEPFSGAGRSGGSVRQSTSSFSTLARAIETSSPSNARRPVSIS